MTKIEFVDFRPHPGSKRSSQEKRMIVGKNAPTKVLMWLDYGSMEYDKTMRYKLAELATDNKVVVGTLNSHQAEIIGSLVKNGYYLVPDTDERGKATRIIKEWQASSSTSPLILSIANLIEYRALFEEIDHLLLPYLPAMQTDVDLKVKQITFLVPRIISGSYFKEQLQSKLDKEGNIQCEKL